MVRRRHTPYIRPNPAARPHLLDQERAVVDASPLDFTLRGQPLDIPSRCQLVLRDRQLSRERGFEVSTVFAEDDTFHARGNGGEDPVFFGREHGVWGGADDDVLVFEGGG